PRRPRRRPPVQRRDHACPRPSRRRRRRGGPAGAGGRRRPHRGRARRLRPPGHRLPLPPRPARPPPGCPPRRAPLVRPPPPFARASERVQELRVQIDRVFVLLLWLKWFAALAAATWLSPRSWAGAEASTHPHVWAALFLAGALTLGPTFMVQLSAGSAATRHAV